MLKSQLTYFVTSSLILIGACNGFSVPTPGQIKHPNTINTKYAHEPTILTLPNILSSHQVSEMVASVDSAIQDGALEPTTSYQEDIFGNDEWAQEDTLLLTILAPLLEDGLIPDMVEDDSNAALQAFVYGVTNHPDRLSEQDIILGANIISRREALARWKSEDGEKIMKLSMDVIDYNEDGEINWGSISLGKRYELPSDILSELEQLTPQLLLGSWTTVDATYWSSTVQEIHKYPMLIHAMQHY